MATTAAHVPTAVYIARGDRTRFNDGALRNLIDGLEALHAAGVADRLDRLELPILKAEAARRAELARVDNEGGIFLLRSQSGRIRQMGPTDCAGNPTTREQAEAMAAMLGFELVDPETVEVP